MKTLPKLKIINDPIYGFITIPGKLVFELMEHKYFQRLRRISQMGFSYIVYPGAHHTRFHHALGAMFLMQKAVQVLQSKGVQISDKEEEALYIAILLHDIGHGPFSHAMENSIVEGVSHEQISLLFMEALNRKFNKQLTLAIEIFKAEHPRKFLHQLVSGQLDMDRLDYLKRDSFYTGVPEGTVNSQRLIAMLNVKNDALVVEEKGIYSVESFIVARRLMYWQVYLHKTGIVAEQLLVRVLKRAKQLSAQGIELPASNGLQFFLKNNIGLDEFSEEVLNTFSKLDDYDIISAMKMWVSNDDFVLKNLSKMLLNRDLLKIKVKSEPFPLQKIKDKRVILKEEYNLSDEEVAYFIFTGKMENQAYSMEKDTINLLKKNGKIVDVAKASDQLNLEALSKSVVKYYMCYPKNNTNSYRG
ncbi:HD superfamily phosphohydrolase [Aequorivita sublithincola DSM 14238]|uniref:HD superfamily phosphohydrolase n=1 Tax=Aequorivita sublithincola (strain DSM 14238 / LMG 21431 / ACAM 643 / 9-3) TaxID=746697 RepID=I3YYN2_AEQSU|nr:HD domain-containing protein [Aequorivita sublithincola]AFL82100.1 HD superfamily phosphohydrolase [Aequorivita sublithincola DSM 14238]